MSLYQVFRPVRKAGALGIFSWEAFGPIEAISMEAAIEATRPDPDHYETCGVLAEHYDEASFARRSGHIARSDGRSIGVWPAGSGP